MIESDVDVPGGVAACSSFARFPNALRSLQLKIHSFGTRKGCTRCLTSLSSSVLSPVRRWWLSLISMSLCPTSALASQCSLASLSIKKRQGCCRDAMIHLLWCQVLGTATRATWEGAGRRETRVSGVLLLVGPRHLSPNLDIRGKLKPLAGLRNALLRLNPHNGVRRLLGLVLLRHGWCRHVLRLVCGCSGGSQDASWSWDLGRFAGAGTEKPAASCDQKGFLEGATAQPSCALCWTGFGLQANTVAFVGLKRTWDQKLSSGRSLISSSSVSRTLNNISYDIHPHSSTDGQVGGIRLTLFVPRRAPFDLF